MSYTIDDVEKIGKTIPWLDFLESPEFNPVVHQYWQEKAEGPHWSYHSNHKFDVPDVLGDERYFFGHRYGYTIPTPKAADNSYLRMYDVGPENHPEFHESVREYFGLEYCDIVINHQEPGKVVGMHHDGHRSLICGRMPESEAAKLHPSDIKKYVVFMEDQKPGHMFQWGTECYSNWKAWDIVNFTWYVPHGTANVGNVPRTLFVVAGV